MRRSGRLVAVMVPLALLLAGCSTARDQSVTTEAASSSSLVGLWKVTGVRGWKNTWTVFDARSFTIERDRNIIKGSISYRRDEMLAGVVTWHGENNRLVPWLTAADSFTISGDDRKLLAPDGTVLATLVPARDAPDPGDVRPEEMNTPTLTPEDHALLSDPTPAPTPGASLEVNDLVGTWTAGSADRKPSRPFLTLHADGTYTSSNGCADDRGRWRLLPGNGLLSTGGIDITPACDAIEVPDWFLSARSVTVDGDRLTLFDQHGSALGSLQRS